MKNENIIMLVMGILSISLGLTLGLTVAQPWGIALNIGFSFTGGYLAGGALIRSYL